MNPIFRLYSCILLLISLYLIEPRFLDVGHYPDLSHTQLNHIDCGQKFVSVPKKLSFDKNCFLNNYPNKTVYTVPTGGVLHKDGDQPSNRIIDGPYAEYSEAPWAVFIFSKPAYLLPVGYGSCNGVLITEEWILTTAHCWFEQYYKMTINIGGGNKLGLVQTGIEEWILHPAYLLWTDPFVRRQYDISMIKISTKLSFVTKDNIYEINTICLPKANQSNDDFENTTFYAFRHSSYEQLSDHLMEAQTEILPTKDCYSSTMLCTSFNPGDPRPCGGDSGGGLVQFIDKFQSKAILAGILSQGDFWPPFPKKTCDEAKYHAYWVPISRHINWILKIIKY